MDDVPTALCCSHTAPLTPAASGASNTAVPLLPSGPAVGAAVGVTLVVVGLAAVLGLALYLFLKRRSR